MNMKTMTVAGIMSGTSADGIDVVVVRIAPGKSRPRFALVAHEGFPFSPALRRAVLAAMNASIGVWIQFVSWTTGTGGF